jgi:MFS family permease
MRKILSYPQLAPFGVRDFRILWLGAFLSFTGTWVQNVAQGWYVQSLTNDASKTAMVSVAMSLPVAFFGPIMGAVADKYDKRIALIVSQVVYALGALTLAGLVHFGLAQFWHFITVAFILGCASTVEMPIRQSMVGRVVPREMIGSAVPINAITFNGARILGPIIGGQLLVHFGAKTCYLVNSFSYFAIILSVLAVKADLSASDGGQPVTKDLIMEGMLFTLRDEVLKRLFFLEIILSSFGLAYIPLIPAYAQRVMKLQEAQYSAIHTSVGIGAILGLATTIWLSGKPYKGRIVLTAMTIAGLALFCLSLVRYLPLCYLCFGFIGFAMIMQLNTTNTLFQLLSPDRLRGRVLAMHFWALSGISPIGIFIFGKIGENVSIPAAFMSGGIAVMIGAGWGWMGRSKLLNVG